MVAITAVELNYIILRYLTESEFLHTAFMFDCEARVSKSQVYGDSIPPAVLVKLVQKGLEYMEMEENLKKGENDVDKDFCFLQVMDLIKKVEDEMQQIVTDKKKNQPQTKAVKLARKGKARKVWEREEAEAEADRKARKKEEADRKARKKEEADRKAQKKEEADRKARKKEEADRKARKKEEADRKAQEKEEADRMVLDKKEVDKEGEDRTEKRIRIKIKKRQVVKSD